VGVSARCTNSIHVWASGMQREGPCKPHAPDTEQGYRNSRPYGQNNYNRPGAARLLDPLVFPIDLTNGPPPGGSYCFGRQKLLIAQTAE
jgi:hypothetical protein